MEHGDPNAGGGGGQELIWEEVAAENGEKKEAKADLPGQKVEKEMALEAEKIVKSSPPSADGVARMEKQKEAVESEQQPKMGPTVDGQQAKETETPTTTWSEELSMEPRKRVRLVEAGGHEDGEKKAAESGEAEKEPEKEEGEPVATERKSCVKDENGFTYYKCRFCGLTFNYMTTLKAHERVHNIDAPYTCNKCGEAFHYMCELEYHAKTHLAQKGYKCECGRTFYQYTDLLYHRHPGDDPEPSFPLPASAPVQPILLPSSSQPAIHASDFPTPEFAELGFEPKHQMRVWSDVRSKPYICQYCSKSYSDSRGLAYHMYSHRGERMFNPRASRYLMCRNDNSYISSGLDLKDA